jgi:hypothetical protein
MKDTSINETQINTIDVQFPKPGEDNDTQIFRNNFNAIKVGLEAAHDDLHDIYTNTVRTDSPVTDLGNNTIKNAVLLAPKESVYDYKSIQSTDITIDYNYGLYQIAKIGNDIGISFNNFPNDTPAEKVGKIRLELTSSIAYKPESDNAPVVTFRSSKGVSIKYGTGFPTANDSSTTPFLRLFSVEEPVILEIWQYSSTIYIRYLGSFSEIQT